jgi:hypothetical protein
VYVVILSSQFLSSLAIKGDNGLTDRKTRSRVCTLSDPLRHLYPKSQNILNPNHPRSLTQLSSKNLLPRRFIKTTTCPSLRRSVPVPVLVLASVSPLLILLLLSSIASALPDKFVGRTGHGNATTTTAPRKVAVNREESRERCDGRYKDFRRGAILILGDF